jgi:two-component system cell cycle sensor histidine kinase/response regulator CckA
LNNHAPEPIPESEELFRAALDAIPDPITIHSAIRDETGCIVDFRVDFVNKVNALALGLSAEALTGRRLLEIFPGMRDSGIFDAKVRVVETGEPNTAESFALDLPGAAAGSLVVSTRTIKFGDGYIMSSVDFTARAQAEAALRASEGRYRTLVEESSDAIFVLDAGGRVIEANTAGEQLLGYAPGTLAGCPWDELVTPDGLAAHPLHFTDMREGRTLRFDRELRCADGAAITVELSAKMLPDGSFLHIARDITVRKAAEAHLAQMEGRYRGLLEAAPDAMVVVNGAGQIVLLNLQAEKQFGYGRDELIGQPVKVIIPEGFAERLVADDLRSAADALAQQIGTGIELVARRKDASEFPIEIMLSPLDSAEGILVTAAIRDISVRQAAEAELRRSTQLLETTQAVARVGGWELDAVHDTLYWSAETYRIHETSPDEYTPNVATAIGFYAPESIPLITAAVQNAIERGTPFDLELELITATGRRVSVRAMCTLTVEQGRTTKITGAFQDITERKRLQDQLRQAQRLEAVGQLTGGIAHDFNNLLTAVRGYAEFARRGLKEDERRRDDLDQVIANVDRAAALIRQLLAFSRRQVLQSEVLDPRKVVEGITPLLCRLLGEHVELVTCMAPDLGCIKVDPSQLEQVVVNLAVNAADAMPDGGKLTIELSNVELDAAFVAAHAEAAPGAYVLLAVSDTGIGMDAETRARAFEPFFTTKEVGKGTGMGLATVYGIVKQSGGSIDVYSEPGHGTTFRIYLPRIAEEPTAADAETLAARPSWSGSETILLVEDAPAVRGFARRTLEEYGYTVLGATDGADALAIAAAHGGPIELLVTDVVMPGLQGHQLAAQLVAARPELRVLYVSGFTESSVIHHGVPNHGVAFLPKPFSIDSLGEAVRAVLDRQPG